VNTCNNAHHPSLMTTPHTAPPTNLTKVMIRGLGCSQNQTPKRLMALSFHSLVHKVSLQHPLSSFLLNYLILTLPFLTALLRRNYSSTHDKQVGVRQGQYYLTNTLTFTAADSNISVSLGWRREGRGE
jgi:hypothetical protein